MKLVNQTKNITVCENLEIAKSAASRMKGLLGRSTMSENQGLMIYHCNSVHTFFMRFAIDVAFVDKNLKVCKIELNLKPWRIAFASLRARHCFEFVAGSIKDKISSGDQLHVGA